MIDPKKQCRTFDKILNYNYFDTSLEYAKKGIAVIHAQINGARPHAKAKIQRSDHLLQRYPHKILIKHRIDNYISIDVKSNQIIENRVT